MHRRSTILISILIGIGSFSAMLTMAHGQLQNFNRNLTIGLRGHDVTALQQILIAQGYLKNSVAAEYFDPPTKIAVVKWQIANNIYPSSGYFGPKSRAYLNSHPSRLPLPVDPPSQSIPSPLNISMNQATSVLISNADVASVRVPVLGVNFTAGLRDVSIQEIKLYNNGYISDNAIAGAYLTENDLVIQPYNSISHGVIDFSGLNLQILAGQTRTIWLAIDPAPGITPGNFAKFSLLSSSDILATDASGTAIHASGAFPFNGNNISITAVSNPGLANITITALPIGTNVTAGSRKVLVGSWNFNIDNNSVLLKKLNLSNQGVADPSVIQNLNLFINGRQVGSTTPILDSNGYIDFDESSNPITLHTGANLIQLFADIMGSPGYDVQFEIFNPYDVLALDSQYHVPVATQASAGTDITIPIGTLVITVHH